MVVIVIGMSKSGTTLIARTLHHSGIDMHPSMTGGYSQSKYEDPEAIKILLNMFSIDRLRSLYIPETVVFDDQIKESIRQFVASRSGDWGVKQPWLTLCYDQWKQFLPTDHIVIAAKRSPEGLLHHYRKGKSLNKGFEKRVLRVQAHYNDIIDRIGCPVIEFEDMIKNGPRSLERILSRNLVDIRDGRRHVC